MLFRLGVNKKVILVKLMYFSNMRCEQYSEFLINIIMLNIIYIILSLTHYFMETKELDI